MYVTYNKQTGQLLARIAADMQHIENEETKEIGLMKCPQQIDTNLYYVKNDQLCLRPSFPLNVPRFHDILTNETKKFTDIPKATKVYVNGRLTGKCIDGVLTVNCTHAGKYTVLLTCFPYTDKELVFYAHSTYTS